jgi:sorbitol-specific phosphotransferase system component IIBC
MPAICNAPSSSAMFADQDRANRMPFSMHGMCMASMAAMATASSRVIIETGVMTSVSFVAFVFALILLVVVGVLLSLSGLTGLGGLVGLIPGQRPGALQGD